MALVIATLFTFRELESQFVISGVGEEVGADYYSVAFAELSEIPQGPNTASADEFVESTRLNDSLLEVTIDYRRVFKLIKLGNWPYLHT